MAVTAVDTSVAVPLLVASHHQHAMVATWARGRALGLSGHAMVETYSVLTRLPGDARVSPDDAVVLIDDNFPELFVLGARSARAAHRELAKRGIAGDATYDALVGLAARENGVVLATRDPRVRATYDAVGVETEVVAAG